MKKLMTITAVVGVLFASVASASTGIEIRRGQTITATCDGGYAAPTTAAIYGPRGRRLEVLGTNGGRTRTLFASPHRRVALAQSATERTITSYGWRVFYRDDC